MKEWTGQVKAINSRDFRSDIKLWSFQLEDNDRWFRMGKKEPTFEEGEWISFQERNSQVEWGTITQPAEPVSKSAVVEHSKDSNLETACAVSSLADVGQRIRYQAARRDASRIVVAALHCDHLPHASNIAKAKRLDLLTGYVEQITAKLLQQEEDNV